MFSFLFIHALSALSLPSIYGTNVCATIASSITGSVYYSETLTSNYLSDISHYMTSSTQQPQCVVEVASTQDISAVLKIVGQSRTPFAVKSGGHASNIGFSSTDGVHISLVRLKGITLSSDKSTATIGLGNVWTDVYAKLEGSGVNVVGGRVSGPGVGGFTLGGGYSWLTDQYGLTCDTVASYTLVLPDGTITEVDSSQPDLFFALKGGLNKFGVVSFIKLKTVPQIPIIYGGTQFFGADAIPALITATNTFQQTNTDPKAQVILTINGGLVPGAILLSFYNGPSRPAAFAPYNGINPIISGLKSQSYSSFSTSTPSQLASGSRGAFHTLMTTGLTVNFMNAVRNESVFYSTVAFAKSATLLSYDIEPFLKYGQYATDSAFPHANSPLPLNLYYSWTNPAFDAYWRATIQQSIDYLTTVARKEGIYSDTEYAYPNYALGTYSAQQVYGPKNAARLKAIRAQYDPNGVMDLTGGFKI